MAGFVEENEHRLGFSFVTHRADTCPAAQNSCFSQLPPPSVQKSFSLHFNNIITKQLKII